MSHRAALLDWLACAYGGRDAPAQVLLDALA
jgi:hypothetical protein